MMKGTHVSWLALVGALAVAPLGTVAFGADSTSTPPPATDTTTAPAATETPAAPEKKGDDVTVIQVDPAGPATAEGTLGQLVPGQMTAEDIIGKSVVNAQGETIGEINDIVLDKDKAVYAVLSVGGFLGIGTTYVAVPFDKIQLTTADGSSKVQIVAAVTEEDLKNLAAAQKGEATTTSEAGRSKPADTTTAPAADTTTTTTTTTTSDNTGTAAPATTDNAAAPATTETTTETAKTDTATTESTTAPAAGSADETQVAAAYANVTAEDLIGKKVVNSAGETIGDINDLVIDNQKVVMAVIGVGGFLGIGEKDVAVPLEQLKLSEDKATLASGLTKEDLEKMPAYEKGKLQGVEKGKPIYGSS